MPIKYALHKITVEDYLQGEMLAEAKHEQVENDGGNTPFHRNN